MEVLAFLLKCVDNFTCTSRILKVVFFLSIIIFLIQIIVISTKGWVAVDGTTSVQEGLWYHCDKTGDSTCCQTLENYLFYVNIGTPGWIHGCRAFQIIGLLTGCSCLVLIFLCTSVEQTLANGTLKKACFGVNFTTSGILFISLIIYGSSYKQATWLQNPSLAGSFGVAVCLGFCYFFQGILIMVAIKRSQSQTNPQDTTTEHVSENTNPQQIRVAPAQNPQNNQDNFPSHWNPMRHNQNTLLISLRQKSREYTEIEKEFRKTLGALTVTIVKIERIQICSLYRQYKAAKDAMKQALPTFQTPQIEKHLWHGTSARTVESIVTYGFDRSYCGKNATLYGEGVYFALQTQYSAQTIYSPPDDQGHSRMFRCLVLVGEYTVGDSNMRKPPVKKGHILYDSTVNDATSPTIFVIYNDSHAYPEYLVTFKQ